MSLCEFLEKHGYGDFPLAVADAVLPLIWEIDVEGIIGAGRHTQAKGRTTHRNGYRDRALNDEWPYVRLDATASSRRPATAAAYTECGTRCCMFPVASTPRSQLRSDGSSVSPTGSRRA